MTYMYLILFQTLGPAKIREFYELFKSTYNVFNSFPAFQEP